MQMHRRVVVATGLVFVFAAAVQAGEEGGEPKAATSSLAGYIEYVEGEVRISGKTGVLKPEDGNHLFDGRRASTADGLAELTLSLGSYIRVGPRTELEMLDAGVRSAELRLHRGEAVVDIAMLIDGEVSSIWVGETQIAFEKRGVYRLAVGDNGVPALDVVSGRASVVANGRATKVRKGRSLARDAEDLFVETTAAGEPESELLAWSRERSEQSKKERQALRDSDAEARNNQAMRRMTNRPQGGGAILASPH